jgi:hypothetical protein
MGAKPRGPCRMMDDLIRGQLADLPSLLADDLRRGASLLRRLLGRVTAESVVAPGKSRGFARLHIPVDVMNMLTEVRP